MDIYTESLPPRFPASASIPPVRDDADPECDLCGRPARRETAFQRIHRGDDGVEVVTVCPECEVGTD